MCLGAVLMATTSGKTLVKNLQICTTKTQILPPNHIIRRGVHISEMVRHQPKWHMEFLVLSYHQCLSLSLHGRLLRPFYGFSWKMVSHSCLSCHMLQGPFDWSKSMIVFHPCLHLHIPLSAGHHLDWRLPFQMTSVCSGVKLVKICSWNGQLEPKIILIVL